MKKNKYKQFVSFVKKNKNTCVTVFCFVVGIILFIIFVNFRLNVLASEASDKLSMANNYFANNNVELGVSVLDNIIEQYSNTTASYRARFMKASYLISEKKYEQAEVLLKYIIDNGKPKTLKPLSYPSLILVYEELNNIDKAIELSNEFIKIYSDNYLVPSVMENLARLYFSTNKIDLAKKVCQQIIDTYPNTEYSIRAKLKV